MSTTLLPSCLKQTLRQLHRNCTSSVIQMIWENEVMPHEWLKGLIAKLPNKGNLKECTNWLGITLFAVPSKMLGKILIERLKSGADKEAKSRTSRIPTRKHHTANIHLVQHNRAVVLVADSPSH